MNDNGMEKFLLSILFLLSVPLLYAEGGATVNNERRPLDEKAYGQWIYLQKEQISPDGKWVSYEQRNMDGVRRIVLCRQNIKDTISNGKNLNINSTSKYVYYDVIKGDSVRKRYIMNMETGNSFLVDSFNAMSFLPDNHVLLLKKPKDTLATKMTPKYGMSDVFIINLDLKDTICFPNVVSHRFSSDYSRMLMCCREDSLLKFSVYDMKSGERRYLRTGDSGFSFINADFSREMDRFALLKRYLTDKDTTFRIAIYDYAKMKEIASFGLDSDFMPSGFSELLSPLKFNYAGDALYFKLGRKLHPVKDTSGVKGVNVQIWKWNAPSIPVRQSPSPEVITKDVFCLYDMKKKKVIELSDADMPYFQFSEGEYEDYTLGFNSHKYQKSEEYEAGPRYDVYLVNLRDGSRKRFLEASYYIPSISYDKKYVSWFEPADSSWYVMNTATMEKRNITETVDDIFYNDELDMPMHAAPFGPLGWLDREDKFLVHSKHDVWMFDASGDEAPVCLTGGLGKETGISFRYIKPSKAQRYVSGKETAYFNAFQNSTKRSGYYAFYPDGNQKTGFSGEFRELVMGDCKYSSLAFSKDGNKCIWKKQTFTDYPEVYLSDEDFSDAVKLSESNPQQSEYIWGTSELVEWSTFNGRKLQGILCKPENFDPSRKYPMLVYFYEKRSDNLHRYNIPSPVSTVVNWSYCVSNGYIVFIPDVVFKDGDPGASSYDAVVSGVREMTDRYDFIDEERIGLSGHSWGGYQIAYLITKTDMFKAVVSGAPVSNMTSAYGGIRWETGKSRMFQYEHTQSRIGGTLWEKPMEYFRNSPIFYVPQINTPVLILHNDKDGSVPWEQGIEFFMALRRLDKPAWMLNYKGEGHKVQKWNNRMDYSRKVMGFYDYYLKGAEEPLWMK